MNEPNEQLTPRRNWVANVRFRTLNGIRRWVSNSDRRRRRRRRAERRLSPTSLSVSLLAFTSLDFMTLSHPARHTSTPQTPTALCPRCVSRQWRVHKRPYRVCIMSRIDAYPFSSSTSSSTPTFFHFSPLADDFSFFLFFPPSSFFLFCFHFFRSSDLFFLLLLDRGEKRRGDWRSKDAVTGEI